MTTSVWLNGPPVCTSRWANWVSGGLNHQVEHHLFPSMSIYLYPTISPLVRETCREFGLEYRDFSGYWVALAHCVGYLHELGRPEPEVVIASSAHAS